MTQSTFLRFVAAFAAGLLALSCTKPMETVLSLSDLAANFEASGSLEKTVSVTSNYDWTVSCPEAWVSISPASGTGNGTFKITVAENKTFEARSATVTVKANDKTAQVKVSQLALTPSILVSPATLEVEAAGGTVSVDITSNAPWTISVPADGSWVTPDATSGEGSKKATFTVAPNTDFATRSVDVTFTAQDKKATVKISQKEPDPTLDVNPSAVSVDAEGGSVELTVASNAPWTISVTEEWITVEPASGQGDAKVILTVAPTEVRAVRSADIIFKETVGNTEKTVHVEQQALPLGHKADSLALVAIYNASDGASWKSDRVWDLTKPMDQWYGVTLKDGRVSALKLLKATITKDWTMPAELADLTELTDLRFIDCKVNGSIPDELYGLAKLTTLYLTNNKVTGTLSEKVGQWTEMTNLYVDQNPDLAGELPKALGTLKKLVNLNVSKTSIGGTIPSEITGCDALKNFMAYSTKFSGEVPDFWDQLASLELVQLYDIPTLTGGLPASFGNCKKLKNIYMYGNNLTGNIPEAWANLPTSVINVRIMDNKLKGVVPAAVQAHAKWSSWKPEQYILPQQDGYGLTLYAGNGGQDLDNPIDTDHWN